MDGYNEAGNTDSGRKTVAQAGWATPNCMDHLPSGNLEARKLKGGCSNLKDQVAMLSAASGPTPNGSPAQTEKPGQLAPEFSRWVMGYSAEHLSCAPTATQLCRPLRRNSSPRPVNQSTNKIVPVA